MTVREHHSRHEAAERLPIVTESALVVETAALDRDRTPELRETAGRILDEFGHGDLVEPSNEGAPAVDWDAVDGVAEREAVPGSAAERLAALSGRRARPYPSLLSVELEGEEELEYEPGQYVTVRFHDTPRPYSVANAPGNEHLQVCVRLVPDGRLTPDLFENLAEGDEVTVRGPAGEFLLGDRSGRDMAFVATGTGVAPLKSMIEHVFDRGLDRHDGTRRDVWLVLGSAWEDDLPYHDEFRRYDERRENFHYVPTLSRERCLSHWEGETAYVQHVFLKYLEAGTVSPSRLDASVRQYLEAEPAADVDARLDPGNLEVYACGVNAMVHPLVETVRNVGVPGEFVEAEGYG